MRAAFRRCGLPVLRHWLIRARRPPDHVEERRLGSLTQQEPLAQRIIRCADEVMLAGDPRPSGDFGNYRAMPFNVHVLRNLDGEGRAQDALDGKRLAGRNDLKMCYDL